MAKLYGWRRRFRVSWGYHDYQTIGLTGAIGGAILGIITYCCVRSCGGDEEPSKFEIITKLYGTIISSMIGCGVRQLLQQDNVDFIRNTVSAFVGASILFIPYLIIRCCCYENLKESIILRFTVLDVTEEQIDRIEGPNEIDEELLFPSSMFSKTHNHFEMTNLDLELGNMNHNWEGMTQNH